MTCLFLVVRCLSCCLQVPDSFSDRRKAFSCSASIQIEKPGESHRKSAKTFTVFYCIIERRHTDQPDASTNEQKLVPPIPLLQLRHLSWCCSANQSHFLEIARNMRRNQIKSDQSGLNPAQVRSNGQRRRNEVSWGYSRPRLTGSNKDRDARFSRPISQHLTTSKC